MPVVSQAEPRQFLIYCGFDRVATTYRWMLLTLINILCTNIFAANTPNVGFSDVSYGLKSAVYARNVIMGNPPLPLLFIGSGHAKFSIQPAYVTGSLKTNSNGSQMDGNFYGGGLALSGTIAISNRLAFYIMGMGAGLFKAGFTNTYGGSASGQSATLVMSQIKSDFATLNTGIDYALFGGKTENVFSSSLFFGPTANYASLSQHVRLSNWDGTTANEFDMKATKIFPGGMAGVQLGIHVLRILLINPYFIGTVGGSRCFSYTASNITAPGSLETQHDTNCSDKQVNVSTVFQTLGLNVEFLPLNLSVNVFNSVSKPSDVGLKDLSVQAYVVAQSFGSK